MKTLTAHPAPLTQSATARTLFGCIAIAATALPLCAASTAKAASRDTLLVTRLESQDSASRVLGASNLTWEMIDSERLRQRQFSDTAQGAAAKLELEQIFDLAGRTLLAQVLDTAGRVVRRTEHSYDAQGRLSRLVFFDASAPAGWRHQIITYSHRQDGQVSEANASDTSGNALSKLVYRYGNDGRLQESEELRQGQTFLLSRHRWSSDGRQDTVTTLASGTDSVEVRLKVMNADGKVTSEWVSIRLNNGSWFARETRTTYDGSGHVQRQDNHDANGVLISRVVYRYETVTLTPPVTRLIPAMRRANQGREPFLNGTYPEIQGGYRLDGRWSPQ